MAGLLRGRETPKAQPHPWLGLAACVAVCFAAGALGGAATAPKIDGWYAGLAKPAFNPPNWIFGPVWSMLYLCMAVAAWSVWRQRGLGAAVLPLGLFGAQLALNVAWSWLFFGLESPGLAFVEVVVLWAVIAGTLVAFWRRSMLAGSLLVPYLAWVSFASVLNFAIWRLNG